MALRIMLPRTLSLLTRIQPKLLSSSSVRTYYRNPWFNDSIFGSASNVFRGLEREFDRMQRQFDNSLGGFISPASESRSLAQLPYEGRDQSDMITTEADGTRKFHLSFDMRGFEPEEIKIKTQNGMLVVSAKREEKDQNTYSMREWSQSYSLPHDLNMEELKSHFSDNGILSVEAPLPKAEPKHKPIQIEHSHKQGEQSAKQIGQSQTQSQSTKQQNESSDKQSDERASKSFQSGNKQKEQQSK